MRVEQHACWRLVRVWPNHCQSLIGRLLTSGNPRESGLAQHRGKREFFKGELRAGLTAEMLYRGRD
jgi:hypothetical protein